MLKGSFRPVVFSLAGFLIAASAANAQSAAPNVSQVLVYSTVGNLGATPGAGGTPFTLNNALLGVFSQTKVPVNLNTDGSAINVPSNYSQLTSSLDLSSALNANIATALSIIPLASPASGVILKQDSTGAAVPANSTLGPVFTERAETIGKGKFYAGITSQSFQFKSLNGNSLNGVRMFYGGGQASNITLNGTTLKSYPATFDLGLNVNLSQTTAFFTYGVTNRFDVSVGLPTVHSAVSSRAYNAQAHMGTGDGSDSSLGYGNCWCSGTLTPGAQTSVISQIGQSSASSTGFGDVLLRFKGIAKETGQGVLALGTDLRLPSGDSKNYHGIGTTAIKPFAAFSWFAKPLASKIVFAPHAFFGWQFTGKSYLGGSFLPSQLLVNGISYLGAPFTPTKDYLPDVLSWTVGTEVAFGPRHTFIFDLLGNQIGLIHGVQKLVDQSVANQLSPTSNAKVTVTGLSAGPRASFGQYNGSFGYKAKLVGNLVLTLNGLVRFDSNGLTDRFVPLYGMGYSF